MEVKNKMKSDVDRRSFMGMTMAAGAGLALQGSFTQGLGASSPYPKIETVGTLDTVPTSR